ncbi:MAG: hypothetical protein QXV60_04400, partial [Nitrososphaerota archaeon]
ELTATSPVKTPAPVELTATSPVKTPAPVELTATSPVKTPAPVELTAASTVKTPASMELLTSPVKTPTSVELTADSPLKTTTLTQLSASSSARTSANLDLPIQPVRLELVTTPKASKVPFIYTTHDNPLDEILYQSSDLLKQVKSLKTEFYEIDYNFNKEKFGNILDQTSVLADRLLKNLLVYKIQENNKENIQPPDLRFPITKDTDPKDIITLGFLLPKKKNIIYHVFHKDEPYYSLYRQIIFDTKTTGPFMFFNSSSNQQVLCGFNSAIKDCFTPNEIFIVEYK